MKLFLAQDPLHQNTGKLDQCVENLVQSEVVKQYSSLENYYFQNIADKFVLIYKTILHLWRFTNLPNRQTNQSVAASRCFLYGEQVRFDKRMNVHLIRVLLSKTVIL